jgi:hypothetical protein
MRAHGEPHVAADEADRERSPAVARTSRGVERQHVERDGVAWLERPAEDRVRIALGLDVRDLLERAVWSRRCCKEHARRVRAGDEEQVAAAMDAHLALLERISEDVAGRSFRRRTPLA